MTRAHGVNWKKVLYAPRLKGEAERAELLARVLSGEKTFDVPVPCCCGEQPFPHDWHKYNVPQRKPLAPDAWEGWMCS